MVTIRAEEIETLTARFSSGFWQELYKWQVDFEFESSTADLIVDIYCPPKKPFLVRFEHSIRIDQEILNQFLKTDDLYDLGISSASERTISIQAKGETKICRVCGNLAVAEFEPIWECAFEQIRCFLTKEHRSHCDHRNRIDLEAAKIEWSRPWKEY